MSPGEPGTASNDPDALMRSAFPLHQAGKVDEAHGLYLRILSLAPGYADAHYLLGTIERDRGAPELAIAHFRRAVAANPDEPTFGQALGQALLGQQRWAEAAASLSEALQRNPAQPEIWNACGCAHQELGQPGPALRCFERAVALAPDHAPALHNGGRALRDLGRAPEAIGWLRRARDLARDNPDVFSNYLFTLNLDATLDRAEICREHQAYDRTFGSGLHGRPVQAARDPDPGRKLRIGYFSPDLRRHAVSYFVEPVLAHHDRRQFEVFCYHLHPARDEISEALQALSDRWVDAAGLEDADLASRIAADGIDILVDLAGHTSGNRLPVLARKPAPVQVTWLGYLNTTGLAAVDYRITDAQSDPPGTEAFHTERLARLPHAQWCFQRPASAAPVSPLPAIGQGRICFGSMNKSSKLSREVLELWAETLARVPGSVLLFAGVAEDQREIICGVFAQRGIAAERLEFTERLALEEFRRLHDRVDIAFDAHPYSGATTTFDSLWMGVPTLTLAGAAPISRSTSSILATLGLEDWVARSPPEFVSIAAAKAADVAGLSRLRTGLRLRLQNSILMDGARFTRELEAQYRAMWRAHCAGQGPTGASSSTQDRI